MGVLIGIDFGEKRTGLAITDDLQIAAFPLETLPTQDVLAYLEKLMKEKTVDALVLGMPRRLDGSDSETTAMAERFRKELTRRFQGVSLFTQDETYTSKMAADALKVSGLKKKKRREKGLLDKMSASLILQAFMERRAGKKL